MREEDFEGRRPCLAVEAAVARQCYSHEVEHDFGCRRHGVVVYEGGMLDVEMRNQ